MLTAYDYVAMAVFVAVMLAIGLLFRQSKDSSDYFRAGGSVLWWLAGAGAFMVAFSAWTFTGGASKAYADGTIILVLYLANCLGFLLNWAWSAARFRQMRVITAMEAVRARFGFANEQVFTWIQVPMAVVSAGLWLNGLGVFMAAVFGFDLTVTMVAAGVVVLAIVVLGGAWALAASDFIQVLLLMPVTVIAAIFALSHPAVGGVDGFIERLPARHSDWTLTLPTEILVLWVVAIVIKQAVSSNNLLDSQRYLCVKDARHARKAAGLGATLFLLGAVVWFVPPMASAIAFPDLRSLYPALGEHAADGAYVAICMATLPAGMMGLLISGIFAATISSIDGGLNKNAGILVRSFYHPVLRPKAGERELLLAGKLMTVAFGTLVILIAVWFSRLEGIGLFNLMLQFGSLVALPYALPLILGVLVRRAPAWAGWSTVLIGFTVSLLLKALFSPDWLWSALGHAGSPTRSQGDDLVLMVAVLVNAAVCVAWFLAVSRLGREGAEDRARADAFFRTMDAPLIERDGTAGDRRQQRILGRLSVGYGLTIVAFALIPNHWSGRLAFLGCASALLVVGWLLLRAARRGEVQHQAEAA
jgi:Na+/proline symporter